MRSRTFACLIALLLLSASALAQNSEFPTLDALANLTIPVFNYSDMVERMSPMNTDHTPPAERPQYAIGDRDWFQLTVGEDGKSERVEMELRGQTNRVLIWVQTSVDYPNWRANSLAHTLETQVLNPMQALFKTAEPPGVDGDDRMIVAMMHDPEGNRLGYFSVSHTQPRRIYSKSNQREMLVVNLALDEKYTFFDKVLLDVIAHEYLHVLHFHSDVGEDLWLDEALASYAGHITAEKRFETHGTHSVANSFLESPNIGLTQWQAVEKTGPKYGAGVLFMLHLARRFGDEIVALLLAEPSNGWSAVSKVLREYAGADADEVFADWVLSNYFLDARRGYGYRDLDHELTPPKPIAALNSFPAEYEGELPQYSTDYIAVDVRGADKLFARLWQAPEASFVDEPPPEGERFAYAVATDFSNSRLTLPMVLTAPRQAWLTFRIWYDLAPELEYGYITISEDGGQSWQALRGRYTELSEIYDEFFTYGYTGDSRNWKYERLDLSAYTPGHVLLRFEVVSNVGTSYRGMAIDDLRIQALNFHEGFETPRDTWEYEGWIRTDNRLPNNTWLQVVQDTGDKLHVSRELVNGNGDLTVDLLPGVSQALVAISPIVPQTGLPTKYEFEAYLLNEAGEVMVVSRECSVTTTDPLNFRAVPNGNKIGLLPKGTTVDALDKQEDWFQVDYNGVHGWVHGDYVIPAGNCP